MNFSSLRKAHVIDRMMFQPIPFDVVLLLFVHRYILIEYEGGNH